MKIAYDIYDMTITQFLQFCLLFIVFVPIQLILQVFILIGNIANEFNLDILVFANSLAKRLGLPRKDNRDMV